MDDLYHRELLTSRELRRREDAMIPPSVTLVDAIMDTRRPVSQFLLKSVSDDHLVCRTWDGATEGSANVNVAKPPALRRTGWHGVTVVGITYTYTGTQARTAVQGTTTENQVIIPAYQTASGQYIGNVIYAVQPQGGTGVVVNGEAVVWQDLNVDGRAWAKV